MNDKVALSMICRGDNELKNIKRSISSIRPYVDAAYLTITNKEGKAPEVEKLAQELNVQTSYHYPFYKADKITVDWLTAFFGYEPHMKDGDELFLFDEARNFNKAQIPKEYGWLVWIDSDDFFRGGQNLKNLAMIGLQQNVGAFYFKYLYQTEYDEEPNGIRIKHIIIEHLRERLVRNSDDYKWISPIHETLIEQRPTVKTDNYDCEVVHLSTHEDRMRSLTRNLKNLELAIYKTDGKDPRHLYYLAKAFFDLGTEDYDIKAEKLIKRYLLGDEKGEHRSGWPEERSQAREYLAEIHKRRGRLDQAITECLEAMREQPEIPSIYLNLASCYMIKGEWERALYWVRFASTIPEHKTTLISNPRDTQGRTLEIIYNSCLNLNKIDEAWAAAEKMKDLFPDHDNVKNAWNFTNALRNERDLSVNTVKLVEELKKTGETFKIQQLLRSLPATIEGNPYISGLNNQYNPPRVWEDREIAIYCGMGFTDWGPNIMKDPKNNFVGGSEEAVILMSEALAKKGWKVTVYNTPGTDEGEHNGVKWEPFYKFNRRDEFNILIGWRDIRFFDTDFKAKKRYLWCHDIQNPQEYTPERVDRINKVFFLSKWHRDNIPSLLEEKVLITSNGI